MKRPFSIRFPAPLFLALVILVCWALPCLAAPARDKLITAIEKKYTGNSFTADFTQVSTLAALDMSEEAVGRAWFSYPRKMKWQYLKPDRHEIITNGTTLWIHRPHENQVMVGNAAPFFQNGAGGAFLADMGKIRNHYEIQVAQVEDNWTDLVLTPIETALATGPASELKSIHIRVLTPSHQIQQVTTTNIHGDTTRITFTRIQFTAMPDNWFDFTVPEGTDILKMDE